MIKNHSPGQDTIMKKKSTKIDPKRAKAISTIKALLFSASVISSLLAGAIAYRLGSFHPTNYAIMFFGVVLGQLSGDYLYYYFTNYHTNAKDTHTKLFAGWKPYFAETLIKGKQNLYAGLGILFVDLLIGLYFIFKAGLALAIFVASGGLIVLLFTPLMFYGLKEVVVFLAFGPLAMTGMIFVLTGKFSWETLIASIPVALWVTAVAHLKSGKIKKIDERAGTVSLTVSRNIITALLLLSYVSLGLGVAFAYIPVWSLLALLTLPLSINVVMDLGKPSNTIVSYLNSTIKTIFVLVCGGLLMSAGYLI